MKNSALYAMIAATLWGSGLSAQTRVVVENNLNIPRNELVSIDLKRVKGVENNMLRLREVGAKQYLNTQLVDLDQDGKNDELLFQVVIPVASSKEFVVEPRQPGIAEPDQLVNVAYSRFVPERSNDYAWENDRVAFRIYGTRGAPGSGGGIDGFLKRVEYPIINRWYKNNAEKEGAYHIDTGEGYDPYQVGRSRGIGGSGIWLSDSLHVPANFIESKTIAVGPLRTIFELTYAPWTVGGTQVQEIKRVSLDRGSNLTRHEVTYKSSRPVGQATAGITLHDQKGTVTLNEQQGWFSYWEPMDETYLGTGIVVGKRSLEGARDHRSGARDQSHLLVHLKPTDGRFVYYAGYGWTKSGQFANRESWNKYLGDFAARLASPLIVRYK